MNAFLEKHRRRIAGTLSCVDRIVFKEKLHVRGLIAKMPHSRRWRVAKKGIRVLGPLVEAYA